MRAWNNRDQSEQNNNRQKIQKYEAEKLGLDEQLASKDKLIDSLKSKLQ